MMSDIHQSIVLDLTENESELLAAFAHEHGLSSASDALHALLSDAMNLYDELWDKTFADSQDFLDQLADEAHADYVAGRVEDFDPDSDLKL